MKISKSLNKFAKGTFWFSISYILQKAISLVSTPIFTRIMTTEQYGTYSMYSTWLSIITVIATLNIYGPIYNTLSHKYSEKQNELLTNSLFVEIITIALSLIVFFTIEIFTNSLSGINITLLILIFANIISNLFSSLWIAKSKYENNYLMPSIATIVQAFLSLGLSITLCYLFDEKVYGRIIGSIIPMTLLSIVAIYYFIKNKSFKLNKNMIKNIVILSAPLVFHYLAQDVLGQGDRIFIEQYFGESNVAIYSLSYSLAFLPLIIVQAINSTFAPWKFKRIDEKNDVKLRKVIPYFAILVFSIVLVITLLGPEVIFIFGGESYSSGAQLIPFFSASVMFVFFYDIYSTTEFYYGKTIISSIITVIAAILNIVLNFFIVPSMGIKGAALTTFISYLFMAISHFIASIYIFKKNDNFKNYYNTVFMIIFTIGSSTLLLLIYFLYNFLVVRIIITIVYIVFVAILMALNYKKIISFITNKEE